MTNDCMSCPQFLQPLGQLSMSLDLQLLDGFIDSLGTLFHPDTP